MVRDLFWRGGEILVSWVIMFLLIVPLVDAWVNYGIVTGVFATFLLGLPLLFVGKLSLGFTASLVRDLVSSEGF